MSRADSFTVRSRAIFKFGNALVSALSADARFSPSRYAPKDAATGAVNELENMAPRMNLAFAGNALPRAKLHVGLHRFFENSRFLVRYDLIAHMTDDSAGSDTARTTEALVRLRRNAADRHNRISSIHPSKKGEYR